MKKNKFSCILLIGVCTMLFSCGQKSGMETKVDTDTVKINHIPVTVDKENLASAWSIDAKASNVKFAIQNMGMRVDGTFGGFKGSIFFDDKNLKGSRFDVSVEVNTINTGIGKRDKDLMAEKFFEQDKFQQIVFHSDSVIQKGDVYEAVGDFNIKGISQHRAIPFTFKQSGDVGIFKSVFVINRLDFNVGGNGPVMGTNADVTVEIIAKKI